MKKMDFLNRHLTPLRKNLPNREHLENTLAASPVPYILVTVLIWAVASVLLLLSENHQRDMTVWVDGQHAPFAVWARMDFAYVDSTATGEARQHAMTEGKYILRTTTENSKLITQRIDDFFTVLRNRKNPDFTPGGTLASQAAVQIVNYDAIKDLDSLLPQVKQQLAVMLNHGIIGKNIVVPPESNIRVITPDEITYHELPQDFRTCAVQLAALMKIPPHVQQEVAAALEKLLEEGNIYFDENASRADAQARADAVKPVVKFCNRGDLIVARKQLISREVMDMLAAERSALPAGYGLALLGNQLLLSIILLLTALFFLHRTYPQIFRNPRDFSIAGFSLIISLVVNFAALQLFFYLFRRGVLADYELMFFIMPIPFGAALISILLGNRTAMFSGFIIASISALMIMPDRSFELALRWFSISALTALFIRNVTNYRSFFVRVFLCGTLLTALVNGDVIYSFRDDPNLLRTILMVLFGNSLFCGIMALLAVFVFELLFNVDTSMSLMVLNDFNHPLLERLKRNAPGTMFHCMTVATLSEDAARAIHGNPARAKAGALFHDIGKLAMPQYFVENNVDSPGEYEKMPPLRCCSIIRSHVSEGLELAREYRLCSFIREAIITHHGDDLISFFYHRAVELSKESGLEVDEALFRYEGYPPMDKELTIISLADACEAASRSLNKPTPENIEKLVNDIFIHRMRGGQLRNSQLTLEELDVVRKCFVANLTSLNHSRIAYKKESVNDKTVLPVEKSQLPGTEKK